MLLFFYLYLKCGMCWKVKKWLDDNGVVYEEIYIVENLLIKE